MVERFTESARRVLVLASEEARRRRHVAIGPEHLFAGLVHDADALGVKWLQHLQVSPEQVSAEGGCRSATVGS